jgi:NAD(P)-dependent dehydrogenase (short-subunit alcohol dehydrogenase family)
MGRVEIRGSAALVTGAASGLGAATAAALDGLGADVYGLDLDGAVAGAAPPDGVTPLPGDVTEEDGCGRRWPGSTTTGSRCGSR